MVNVRIRVIGGGVPVDKFIVEARAVLLELDLAGFHLELGTLQRAQLHDCLREYTINRMQLYPPTADSGCLASTLAPMLVR